jgi:HEAT repeat protein
MTSRSQGENRLWSWDVEAFWKMGGTALSEAFAMRPSLLPLFAVLLGAFHAGAAPAPPPGPSPEAVRLVEARRKALSTLEYVDLQRVPPEQQAETLRKMEAALKDLEAALTSKDTHVFTEAVRDLMNSEYRAFPKDRILPLLLPRVKRPETRLDRMTSQGFIMELLARWYGSKARTALPDLLAMLTDDTVNTYLRGKAIDAAAQIAPGDEVVLKAFITALNNRIVV